MYYIAPDNEIVKAVKKFKQDVKRFKIESHNVPKFLVQNVMHDTNFHDLYDDPVKPWQKTHNLLYRSRWILEALDGKTVFADVPVESLTAKRQLTAYRKEYDTARINAIEACKRLMKKIEENPESYSDPERLKNHNITIGQKYEELRSRYSMAILWHVEDHYVRERAAYTLLYYLPPGEMPWMLDMPQDYEDWRQLVMALNGMLSVINIVLYRFRGETA